jgi:DNA-binding NarL/FixJ family response regulator
MSAIRVVVVDDQTLVRQGILSLLRLADDIEVVAEANGGEAALRMIPVLEPDVVLLDVRMPDLSGLEVMQRLAERGESRPTLILTTFDDDEVVFACLRLGARGYLLKDVSLERLLSAIRTIAGGGTMLQPALTDRVLHLAAMGGGVRATSEALLRPEALTERETEVLRLMAGGYSNREIADGTGVVEGTVKNHVSSVLGKLGVRDRTRAVLKALELGLI